MRLSRSWVAVAALPAIYIAGAVPAAPSDEARTSAKVLEVDHAWTDAEINGDAAFVDALLLPEYRSIGPDGKITDKAAIVAHARARGPHSDFGKLVADYKATHPTRGDVVIDGDTAVLNWVSLAPGKGEPIASCDIFVYRHGRWRALYSQHTTAEM
jgi:hypothetical protein